MRRIKKWLIERILPVWAREELLSQIEQLRKDNDSLRHQIALRDEYISGLEAGMRAQRRIIINTGEGKK